MIDFETITAIVQKYLDERNELRKKHVAGTITAFDELQAYKDLQEQMIYDLQKLKHELK